MNRTKLKNYAPQARRDFIQAMIDRAAFYGLTAKKTEPVESGATRRLLQGESFRSMSPRNGRSLRSGSSGMALIRPWKPWLTPGSTD